MLQVFSCAIGIPVHDITQSEILGRLFGLTSLVYDGEPRSTGVRAAGRAKVVIMDRLAFIRQIYADPDFVYGLVQQACVRIAGLNRQWHQAPGRSAVP